MAADGLCQWSQGNFSSFMFSAPLTWLSNGPLPARLGRQRVPGASGPHPHAVAPFVELVGASLVVPADHLQEVRRRIDVGARADQDVRLWIPGRLARNGQPEVALEVVGVEAPRDLAAVGDDEAALCR